MASPIQLLTNPDAEESKVGGNIPGWTILSGNWTYYNQDPSPQSGSRYFYPGAGTSGTVEMYQDVDVSAYADVIDDGRAVFKWQGYVSSWDATPQDESRQVIEYRDEDGTVLESYDTGFSAPASWTLKTDQRVAPANTRTIRCRLLSRWQQGSYIDGRHDNLALYYYPPTKEAIEGGSAVLAYVVEIEGYDALLTNWPDTSAVTTAYSGTDWASSTVLRGLKVTGEFTQEIRPLAPEIDSGTMTFFVTPDSNDTFAKAVFSSFKSDGNSANLTTTADNDDTTIHVDHSGDLPASTDYAYIGTERLQYGAKTGTDRLTSVVRGYNSPFAVDGGTRFGRWHAIGETAGEASYQPPVTDWKRIWIGSYIALRAFRVSGTQLDPRDSSHLLFAGTIADIQDTESGDTQIVAVDIRKQVADTVLLSDQFSAQPTEGVVLGSRDRLVLESWGRTTGGTWNDESLTIDSSDLGTGQKTVHEVIDAISDAIDAGSLSNEWMVEIDSDGRTRFRLTASSGTYDAFQGSLSATKHVCEVLGFDVAEGERSGDLYTFNCKFVRGSNPSTSRTSHRPHAYAVPQLATGTLLTVAANTGTFVNQGDQIPEPIKSKYNTTSGTWGFLRYGDFTFLAKQATAVTYNVYWDDDVHRLFRQSSEDIAVTPGDNVIRAGDPIPRFTQVLFFEDDFADVLPRIFASTGTSGYNHATYDAYDRQMGCAIPWELLGDRFLESCRELSEINTTMSIVLDKPTRLVEILIPELALRNAHLVFKDGLRFSRPSGAFSTADHALTDSTMVDDPDRAADARPEMIWSRDMIMNVLKVEYNRGLDDKYHDTIEIRNQTSISEYGVHNPITIKARNTVLSGKTSDANAIYELVSQLAGDLLAIYDEPLQVVTVSCAGSILVDMAPGDSVSLSNSFLRYHGDGTRGVTNVAAYVLRTSFDMATLRGEVTLVLTGADLARAAVYSPAAKIDETYSSGGFTAGYNSSSSRIVIKPNEYTYSGDGEDGDHFSEGDIIRVIEKSPSSPASPQNWSGVVLDAKISSTEWSLDQALTGFDTSKEYYVVSDDYGSAGSTQQTDTYIADDADDKINDAERSRTFRDNDQGIAILKDPKGSTDVRHEYPPTDGSWWSENKPFHPAMWQALINSVNNLVSHRTAPQCPPVFQPHISVSSTSETGIVAPFWMPLLGGFSRPRTLNLAPMLYSAHASNSCTITVYSSSTRPVATTSASTVKDIEFTGPTRSVSFTATGTSIQMTTASTLTLMPAFGGAGTWITMTGYSASASVNLAGFHTWYLSAVS